MNTHPVFSPTGVATHHSLVSRVECDTLTSELRTHLLSVRSKDQRTIQLRKDVQQGKNKAPETIAALISDAFNSGDDVAGRMASTIRSFFSARTAQLQRRVRDLMQVETVEEGEFNNVQMKIAQGDLSRPTLIEMKKEIGEYRAILDELDAAVDAELYPIARNV
jgi:serine kinase of HPr protein (carbohydrate metabolism regulator)